MSAARTQLVVVTGLSGAGKSTALHALEDLGFFCIDNTPPPVLTATLGALEQADVRRVAFGIDVRVRSFLEGMRDSIDALATQDRDLHVLFLDAADQALLRRFSGTRRPHPLSTIAEAGGEHAATALLDGIRIEREKLAPLRARATSIVDTTRLSVHELRRRVIDAFGAAAGGLSRLRPRFVSFGFKYGAPVDADLLLDVRFLPNPYFVPELTDLSGLDEAVREYVLNDPESKELLRHAQALLAFCLPRFEREGKAYVTIGIGCTGGRHRSVALAERLAAELGPALGLPIDVVHRDVDRVTLDRPSEPSESGPSGGRA